MLRVEHLHLRRGDFELGPMVLNVERGSYLAVVGPSGCGKTLLLQWMAGFEQAEAGKLYVADSDVTDLPPQRRPLSVVYQNSALFPHLTVRENIGFSLRVRRSAELDFMERVFVSLRLKAADTTASRKRVAELAELLGIAAHLDAAVTSLSGGEQRRVALARALADPRPVLLLDEPLSALDETLRWQLSAEIDRMRREYDLTVVHVTHDLSVAASVASHLAVLGEGKLLQTGWREDVLEHPASAAVARAVGATNFIEARGDADRGVLRLPGGGELPAPGVPAKQVRARIDGLRFGTEAGERRVAGLCIGQRRQAGQPTLIRVALSLPDDEVTVELPAEGDMPMGTQLFVDFAHATYDYY